MPWPRTSKLRGLATLPLLLTFLNLAKRNSEGLSLLGGHFYIVTVSGKAIFELGKESEEALAIILENFRTKPKGSGWLDLSAEDRKRAIKQNLSKAKARSYAEVAKAGNRTAQNSSPKAAPDNTKTDRTKSKTPCWRFDSGSCNYTDEACWFTHVHQSTSQRVQRQKTKLSVVKAGDQQSDCSWQKVPSRSRQLLVQRQEGVRPVSWRNSLRKTNRAAYDLVTWVDCADGDEWMALECKTGEEEKLAKLLAR